MDDKKAANILIRLSKKYSLNAEEKEAISTAVGALGWTALAKSGLKNLGKKRRAQRDKGAKW